MSTSTALLAAYWRTFFAFVWILVLAKAFGRATEVQAIAIAYTAIFLGSLTPWLGEIAGRLLRKSGPRLLLIAAIFLPLFRRGR